MARPLRSLAGLLLVAAPALAQPFAVEVTASSLNVRSAPSGTVLGQVANGQRFVVARQSGDWLAIDHAGRSAWISASYARRVAAAGVQVTADSLNVRTGPGVSNARIGSAASGQRYVLLEQRSGWCRIQFDRREAWVSGDYVRVESLGGQAPPTQPAPPPPPPVGGAGWASLHRGLTLGGAQLPRAGIANATLRRALGVAVEPRGEVVSHQGASFVRGRVSWFGGPRDTGVTSTETGAITGERLRSLNSPLNPGASTLAQRPADYYYCAMRFDYTGVGVSYWRGARLLVVNPANGKAIVVRCADWGPNTSTGRVIDLSPQALTDLGMSTDGNALISFADPAAPLGVVR